VRLGSSGLAGLRPARDSQAGELSSAAWSHRPMDHANRERDGAVRLRLICGSG
jgi:hypothetical protein